MKISRLIPQQVPSFIRSEYPAFVEFLQAYYDWLETTEFTQSIGKLTDIDSTVDSYIEYFRKTYDITNVLGQTDLVISERTFIKKIRELYLSKGSQASLEFLFRVLYNKRVEVKSPWDSVLRSSEATWQQDTSVIVSPQRGDIYSMSGDIINIRNAAGKVYRTFVRSIAVREEGLFELFIDRIGEYEGPFVQVDMDNLTVVGSIVPSIVRGKIRRKGRNFKPGQLFQLQSPSKTAAVEQVTFVLNDLETPLTPSQLVSIKGQVVQLTDVQGNVQVGVIRQVEKIQTTYLVDIAPLQFLGNDIIHIRGTTLDINAPVVTYKRTLVGGSDSVIKVKSVDAEGGLTGVEVVRFGTGYSINFAIAIRADQQPAQLSSRFEFEHTVFETGNVEQSIFPTDDGIGSSSEKLTVVRHDYTVVPSPQVVSNVDTSYVSLDYVGNTIVDVVSVEEISQVDLDTAIIALSLGEVCRYPGNYITSTGLLSNQSYLHDSYKYQAFSYVTSIDEPLEKYASLLKSIIHVAGTKLIGEYAIRPEFNLDLIIDPSLNFIRQQDALYSYVESAIDFTFNVLKRIETAAVTDDGQLSYELMRTLTTTYEVPPDDDTYLMVKRLSSFALSTVVSVVKDVIKDLSHVATTNDSLFNIVTSKQLSSNHILQQLQTIVFEVLKQVSSGVVTNDQSLRFAYIKEIPVDIVQSISTAVQKHLERTIIGSDNVIISDGQEPTLQPNKYISDPVGVSAVGVVYGDPIYAEINPSYWIPGYQDTERVFLN